MNSSEAAGITLEIVWYECQRDGSDPFTRLVELLVLIEDESDLFHSLGVVNA